MTTALIQAAATKIAELVEQTAARYIASGERSTPIVLDAMGSVLDLLDQRVMVGNPMRPAIVKARAAYDHMKRQQTDQLNQPGAPK